MENEQNRLTFLQQLSEESNDEFDSLAKEGWKGKEAKFEKILANIDEKLDSTYPDTSSNIKTLAWVKYAVAAMIIGVGSLYSTWYLSNHQKGDELFAANFSLLENNEETVRAGSNDAEILTWEQKANYDYQQQNYASAEVNYEKSLDNTPDNSKVMLFLAISYLNNDKPEKAIELLAKKIPETEKYNDDVQWYLALAYLKTNQKGTAKLLLEGLKNKKGYYGEKAEMILTQL